MSLLTPVKVPVEVYRWDDVGAPVLNKTAGCMMNIFKSCLVTGYGTKAGAGWTMPFGDAAGVKVLRPEVGAETDFYLRLSADTGSKMSAQIYLNMTDTDTGDLKLQCNSPFKYGVCENVSMRWLLVASSRGVWFFNEQSFNLSLVPLSRSGTYFYSGDVSANDGEKAVYLHHSGANADYSALSTITLKNHYYTDKNPDAFVSGNLLRQNDLVETADEQSIAGWNGVDVSINQNMLTQFFIIRADTAFLLPGLLVASDGVKYNNFDSVMIANASNSLDTIVMGTGSTVSSNFYIATDNWVC